MSCYNCSSFNSQCMNGTITCYESYIPDDKQELNSTQLSLFQDEILRIFYFQYTQQDRSIMVDIRHIHQYSFASSGNTHFIHIQDNLQYYNIMHACTLLRNCIFN